VPLSSWLKLKSDPQKCSEPERSLEDTEDKTVFSDDLGGAPAVDFVIRMDVDVVRADARRTGNVGQTVVEPKPQKKEKRKLIFFKCQKSQRGGSKKIKCFTLRWSNADPSDQTAALSASGCRARGRPSEGRWEPDDRMRW
jgi:hypothetical protein